MRIDLLIKFYQDDKKHDAFCFKLICISIIFTFIFINISAQEQFKLKGMASSWINLKSRAYFPFSTGIRYIPELNYTLNSNKENLFDFEMSLNNYAMFGLHPFDTAYSDGKIRPYRLWCRYSGNQYELRLGLQKINFGPSFMLRPLMWFDQLDVRDPLQLTDGVWGLLYRYYFLNNASIWLWGLYGNKKIRIWEIAKTKAKYPEIGGRFQIPVSGGETALSYHFRITDTHDLDTLIYSPANVPENRIGLDARWDIGIGLWMEGTWIFKSKNIAKYTNQEIINTGIDYTFGIGNGLYTVLENLLFSYDELPFKFSRPLVFSGLSMSYPLGVSDDLGIIAYYDWHNDKLYNFANYKRQYNKLSFYLMAYINPVKYQLPVQGETGNLFSGKGVQIMIVYNH